MKQLILEWLGGIWVMLCLVSISALIILNSTFIYRLFIDYYELPYITGLTRQALLENYQKIVSYLQNPWIRELNMPDFRMSEMGRIHFEEVKIIFQSLYIIIIGFIIALFILIKKRIPLIPILNKGANLIIIVFGLIGIAMKVDFNQAFTWFHKLFFNNNYWVFHPITDPVILALPEELFLILGVGVLVLLLIQCIAIKLWHTHDKKR